MRYKFPKDVKEKWLRVKTYKEQEKYNLEQFLINFLQKLYSEAVITYNNTAETINAIKV